MVFLEGLSPKTDQFTFRATEAGSFLILSAFWGLCVFLQHLLVIEWRLHSLDPTGEQQSFIKFEPFQYQHPYMAFVLPMEKQAVKNGICSTIKLVIILENTTCFMAQPRKLYKNVTVRI